MADRTTVQQFVQTAANDLYSSGIPITLASLMDTAGDALADAGYEVDEGHLRDEALKSV